jgi:phosphoribosyl 1,2-cyclic phosphate phosphodiesterase
VRLVFRFTISIESALKIGNTEITPIEVLHHQLPILGFKFKNLVYITDASNISKSEKEKLKNLDFLIINCLRKTEPHIAHYILPRNSRIGRRTSAKNDLSYSYKQ